MGPGTSDDILGLIRTQSLATTLAVCLGGGWRSPSAFLVLLLKLNCFSQFILPVQIKQTLTAIVLKTLCKGLKV